MLPVHDTDHVAEGLALRTGQYLSAANLKALLTATLNRVQEAEDMLWDVILSQLLADTPTGQALYQIADLVGCPRGSLSDAQLFFLVNVWLLARRSKGHSEDLIGILAKGFGTGNFDYAEYYPAAYRATVWNVGDPTLLSPLSLALSKARPPGVQGAIAWGTWPTATFFLGDSSPGGLPGSGLKDSVSGTNAMGLLSSIEE